MDYQVVLSASARSDIQDIVRYISLMIQQDLSGSGGSSSSVRRSLGPFPMRGRVVPEFEDESIREVITRSYRIVYRLKHDEQLIEIIRFWHASRGTPKFLVH